MTISDMLLQFVVTIAALVPTACYIALKFAPTRTMLLDVTGKVRGTGEAAVALRTNWTGISGIAGYRRGVSIVLELKYS